MNENILPSASLFLGIVPALLLLYISLKGYEGQYKEKNIFLTFIVGIVFGVIAVLIEAVTMNAGVLFIFLFPLMEQLLKTIVLNIGRLQGKKETVIYGLSLGVGFGSIFTPFSLITTRFQGGFSFANIALIVIGSFGIILLHGATGICIGYGVYIKQLPKYVTQAILLYIPVTGFIFLTTIFQVEFLQIGIVLYSVVIYWYITKKLMPRILPDHRRVQRSEKRRKII